MADQKPAFQESPLTFAWIRDPGRDAMEGRMPLLGMLSSSGARIKFQGGCGCVGETTPKYYRRHWKYCKNFMVAILVGADPPHTRKEFRLEPTTEKDPSTRNHVTRPIGEHTKAEMQAGRIYVNTGSWSEMFLNRFL